MSTSTGNVNGSGATQAYYQNLNAKRGVSKGGTSGKAANIVADQYTAGAKAEGKAESVGYTKEAALHKAQSLADAHYASMRGMVESLIGGTDGPHGQAFWAKAANSNAGGVNLDDFQVSDETRAKAQELTGEDGYFGVKKTTDRIMEFAKALGGSNASENTINNLRKGVQAGFDAVAKMYGGFDKLPQLSKDTYDAVMKEFDTWTAGTKLES
ncbi:hypothetical protein R80B4_00428 [Fibrobacteres bacterium R8-0-B4]